jgi:hypothetical protein
VAGVARYVLAELHRKGHPEAAWLTERELLWGALDDLAVPGAPHGRRWQGVGVRPDGVLVLPGQRVAVEVDLTQHSASKLAQTIARYRELLGPDPTGAVLQRVNWYCLPGGALEAVRRGITRHGDPAVMAARPLPAAVPVYR